MAKKNKDGYVKYVVCRAVERGKSLRCADLSDADLSGANLRRADLMSANLYGANLRRADLMSANLYGANLRRADLSGANLSGANLRSADLSDADLRRADLSGANLSGADLSGANLRRANLSCANLSGANLSGADLSDADIRGATWDYMTIGIHAAPQGELIVYKKLAGGVICTLKVPHYAKRSWSTTRKMRVSKAFVLSGEGMSGYDPKFVYKVGEWVEVTNFDDNRWNECSFGIHCFLTIEEAQAWNL